jgi:hypothetical protein
MIRSTLANEMAAELPKILEMLKRSSLIFLTLMLGSFSLCSQNTVGLLSIDPGLTSDGYNLIYPHNQPNVYLIDACGELVHIWEDEMNFRPGNSAYILEDGNLLKTKRDAQVTDDAIWAGGGGEIVEIRTWDNDLIFSFYLNNDSLRLHHDIAPMSNGNFLAIAWELRTEEECLAAGRDTSTTIDNELWSEMIIEVDPSSGDIVWQWRAWDHLIQEFDDARENFGVVSEHPEKIDVNFDTQGGIADWLHVNSIDYNDELDQIMLSVPHFNEIWVIDHSTTTSQAAGPFGGLSNRGGDLMYRWGNPQAYGQGSEAEQKLFFQHDAHWVKDVPFLHPHYGKIAFFNNRVGPDFSEVGLINPTWDMYEWTYEGSSLLFGPSDFAITIQHPEPTEMYSTGLSSIQSLPNGNSLICNGRTGYSFELTPTNQVVWEYKTPLIGGAPATQGDILTINQNLTFRMDRYPLDHPAFDGQTLSSLGWIEQMPDSTFCSDIINSMAELNDYIMGTYPNPSDGQIALEWRAMGQVDIRLYDMSGRTLATYQANDGRAYLDLSFLSGGVYFIQVNDSKTQRLIIE